MPPGTEGPVPIGSVAEIWRFPVKSMGGERLGSAAFDGHGMVGDRRFAVVSTAAPVGKPRLRGMERMRMLQWSARLYPSPEVMAPTGERWELPSAAALAALQLHVAVAGAELHWEHSPERPLVDVRPVSIISVATLRFLQQELGSSFDPARLRGNLVLKLEDDRPFVEESLAGSVLAFGPVEAVSGEGSSDDKSLRLDVRERVPRCSVVSVDPGTAVADPALLRWLARQREGRVAMYATVRSEGMLRVGMRVWLVAVG